jgi:hypothetical protein
MKGGEHGRFNKKKNIAVPKKVVVKVPVKNTDLGNQYDFPWFVLLGSP